MHLSEDSLLRLYNSKIVGGTVFSELTTLRSMDTFSKTLQLNTQSDLSLEVSRSETSKTVVNLLDSEGNSISECYGGKVKPHYGWETEEHLRRNGYGTFTRDVKEFFDGVLFQEHAIGKEYAIPIIKRGYAPVIPFTRVMDAFNSPDNELGEELNLIYNPFQAKIVYTWLKQHKF